MTRFEAMDRELVQLVDGAAAEAARRAGPASHCRPGCFHCCIGPFPITTIDAVRLARGLASAPLSLQQQIWACASEARAHMTPRFPGNPSTGILHSEDHNYDASLETLPCPVLDLESGRCQLYEYRPTACRLHGLPMRVSSINLNHCTLNYRGASSQTIEDVRVAVDLQPVGETLAAEYERTGIPNGLTYIAWAFPTPLEGPALPS